MSPVERAITDSIMRALRKRGAWVLKVHGNASQGAGIPDVLACYRGRLVALEVKQPSEKATALQVRVGQYIQAAGGSWAVVTSVDEALDVLDAKEQDQ